LGPPPYLSN